MEEPAYNLEYSSALFVGENYQKRVGEVGVIQIDMPMPGNCRMCPVCSEYDICLIPVDGKGFGEQNVSEFTEGRPEWCPMKELEKKRRRLKFDDKRRRGL